MPRFDELLDALNTEFINKDAVILAMATSYAEIFGALRLIIIEGYTQRGNPYASAAISNARELLIKTGIRDCGNYVAPEIIDHFTRAQEAHDAAPQ